MSSRISFARALPWVMTRYSPTHVTRWSLKVPLMTWWSKSGASNSWISALGKPFVNGWKCNVNGMHSCKRRNREKCDLPQCLRRGHIHPRGCQVLTRRLTNQCVLEFCVHLRHLVYPKGQYIWHLCQQQYNNYNELLTWDTTLERCMRGGLAPGNQRCMVRDHR